MLVLLGLFLLFGAWLVQHHLVVLHNFLRDQLKDQVHLVVMLGYLDRHAVLVKHLLPVVHGFLCVVSKVLMVALRYLHDLICVQS